MKVISNNIIQLNDGTKVELPQSGHMKLKITMRDSHERVFANGKEFKDGEFKVTFMAILQYLFG